MGEAFGAALFIFLGFIFNDRVQETGAALGDTTWAIVGILAAAFLGEKLTWHKGMGVLLIAAGAIVIALD